MATNNSTPVRAIRIGDDDWNALATNAPRGDRSALLKNFINWYLDKPGATLPDRPASSIQAPSNVQACGGEVRTLHLTLTTLDTAA